MSAQPRWSTVVFDLDGTLCNTIELITASYRHAHREVLGTEMSDDELRTWIGRTLADIYAAWPEHSQALTDAYLEFNLAHLEELQTSYQGIAELLDELVAAGVRIAVATSKRRASALRSLAASGLDDRITVACAMEDTAEHKPAAAPLRHALLQLDAQPENAVYVGDAVVDVQAAKAAGMAQIAVTWGAGERDALEAACPTAVVDTIAELHSLLLGPMA